VVADSFLDVDVVFDFLLDIFGDFRLADAMVLDVVCLVKAVVVGVVDLVDFVVASLEIARVSLEVVVVRLVCDDLIVDVAVLDERLECEMYE